MMKFPPSPLNIPNSNGNLNFPSLTTAPILSNFGTSLAPFPLKRTPLLQISLSPFSIKFTPLPQIFLTPLSNNLPPFLPIGPTKILVKLSVNSVNPILLIEISPLSPKPKLKIPLLTPPNPLLLVLITLICFTLNTLVLMPLLTSLPCSTSPFPIAPFLQSGKLPRYLPP